MVKNKTICIDDEIFNRLGQEENASALINRLLVEHFKTNATKELSLEERKKNLMIKKIELEALKKMEAIQNV
jgi:hypothetical protein